MFGDGCFTGRRFSCSSISKDLAYEVFQLFVDLGYKPNIRLSKRSEKQWAKNANNKIRDQYIISLQNADKNRFLSRIADSADLALTFIDKKIESNATIQSSPRGFCDLDGSWTVLRSRDIKKYDGPVYNLQMDGDPSFVVDGITVHNCDALRYTLFGLFGKAGMVASSHGMDLGSDMPTDISGNYMRAPSAAEFAKQNGIPLGETPDLNKLGRVGTLSELIQEEDDDGMSGSGGFIWSF
jgi:hypothetical protein